jgi:hypothetical protein
MNADGARNMKIALALAASLALMLSSSAHAATVNLVRSGDFARCRSDSTCRPWIVTLASSGSSFAFVPGSARFGAGSNIDDEISQVLKTTPGQAYTISFNLLMEPATANTHFAADFGATTLVDFTNSGPAVGTTETFTEIASAKTTTLAFFGYNALGFDFLSNVSVVDPPPSAAGDPPPTPLPAALPLFATGLGALGLLGCKRKARVSLLG